MRKLSYAVLAVFLLCGCVSTDVNMYPVEGPLSKQRPLPVVKAKAGAVESNSGPMILTLPDKQECKGTWSSAAPKTGSVSTDTLFSAYGGAMFGSTVTTGILPGVNKGQAFVACNRGTTLEAEFYTGSGTANGYGIARDSDGNVYKMLF